MSKQPPSRKTTAPRHGPKPVPRLFQTRGRWYWKPEKRLRLHWKSVSLGDNADTARAEARRLNAMVEAWTKENANRQPLQLSRSRTGPVTVSAMANAYRQAGYPAHNGRSVAPRTRDQYEYLLKRLEKEFGHETAISIDEPRVDEWVSGTAPQTARQVVALARRLWKWAGRKRMISRQHNPWVDAGVGSGNKRRFRFTWADVLHILDVAAEEGRPSVGVALALSFSTVQRITDVIALTDDDIVIERPKAVRPAPALVMSEYGPEIIPVKPPAARLKFVQNKVGFEVDMPLPAATVDMIRKHRTPKADPDCNTLIVSETTLTAYHEKTVSRVFARVRKAAIAKDPRKWKHLKGGQLRDGRRSGFVHLIEQGCSIELATSWSGHTIDEGTAIIEHYLPRTAAMADKAAQFMQVNFER